MINRGFSPQPLNQLISGHLLQFQLRYHTLRGHGRLCVPDSGSLAEPGHRLTVEQTPFRPEHALLRVTFCYFAPASTGRVETQSLVLARLPR